MNRDEIKQYLPHREPMLLVDEMNLDENHVCHSKYHVTGEEFFLQGPFPWRTCRAWRYPLRNHGPVVRPADEGRPHWQTDLLHGHRQSALQEQRQAGRHRRGGSHIDLSSCQHLHLLRSAQRGR